MTDRILKPSEEQIWKKYYPEEAMNFDFPRMKTYDLVYEENKNRKDAIALEYEGTEICYGEFFDKVEEKTEFLVSKGIKEDDNVTISMLMSPEFVYDWYALGRIYAISNLIDPRTSWDGIKRYLEEADSKYILNTDLFLPKIIKAIGEEEAYEVINYYLSLSAEKMPFALGTLSSIIDKYCQHIEKKDSRIENYQNDIIIPETSFKLPDYVANKGLTVVHTGGTTGFPKGVLLSHDNYNSMAYSYKLSKIGFSPNDRFLLIMPPWISYGSGMLHMSLVTGMKATIISKLDSKKMPEYLIKYQPQWFAGVPAHYKIISDSKLIAKKGVPFLKAGAVGGDAMSEELYEKSNNSLLDNGASQGVYPGYALTEATSAFAVKQFENYKPGSVGIPLPGNVIGIFKYDDVNDVTLDEELGYNMTGEICLQTPNQMLGYFTKDGIENPVVRKHSDGKEWLHTGDLGHIDEDGSIFVDGRIKEMITRHDGFKIYPAMIEKVINTNKAVSACKVVGVADNIHKHGEVPKAFIVLKPEFHEQEKDVLKEIKHACEYCLPEYYTENCEYESIQKLPLTPIGKVDFKLLKEDSKKRKKVLK